MKPIFGSFVRNSDRLPGHYNGTSAIDSVNTLVKAGQTVDPESKLFKDAVKEFNDNLKKGSVKRLEIPEGFCGYIDPNSGELRVQPNPNTNYLNASNKIPPSSLIPSVSGPLESIPYEVDPCLAFGLPGSVRYRECGGTVGGGESSGIDWAALNPAPPTIGGLGVGSACGQGPGDYIQDFPISDSTFVGRPVAIANAFVEALQWIGDMEDNCGDIFDADEPYRSVDIVRVEYTISAPAKTSAS